MASPSVTVDSNGASPIEFLSLVCEALLRTVPIGTARYLSFLGDRLLGFRWLVAVRSLE